LTRKTNAFISQCQCDFLYTYMQVEHMYVESWELPFSKLVIRECKVFIGSCALCIYCICYVPLVEIPCACILYFQNANLKHRHSKTFFLYIFLAG
jgi:hypothetical protein